MSCFLVPVEEHKRMACERDSRPLDLSHDRDRERDRSKSDISNHTNSSDPNLLMSRVFVANLPTERVSRDDLEEMFGKCGKILNNSIGLCYNYTRNRSSDRKAISIVSGYGFVQYEEKGIARQACKMENGSLLKGNKLDVKMAFEGQRKGKKNVLVTQPRRELPPPRRESPSRQPFERQRSRSPLRERDAYK
ncbi:hypothetical protein LSAT2_028552 [Lamellibrachia satsuma]|nr:hypothetical protein LSAT2_028552 [Lamellibrachia satsuma]